MSHLAETVRKRVSVRTFNNRPLSPTDRAELQEFLANVSTPFGVPVEFRLLDAKENDLKSPVIVGAHEYVAAKAARVDGMELAVGYAFERFCLHATERGLGSVMLAASLSRKTFERAMELAPNEVMPVASPVGYPAPKRSMRENMMRRAIKADERLEPSSLFFAGSFGSPISLDAAGALREPLELLRLAPSATNRQPWRVVVAGDRVHFFEERTLKESTLGDIQKVDMGIALCHFDLARQEAGVAGSFVQDDPGIATPPNIAYIVTFEANSIL